MANILSELNVDYITIVAALIHETTIESDATHEEIENLLNIKFKFSCKEVI